MLKSRAGSSLRRRAAASPRFEHIHDRMPMVLNPQHDGACVDPSTAEPKKVLGLRGAFRAYAVSTYVNDPKHGGVTPFEVPRPKRLHERCEPVARRGGS